MQTLSTKSPMALLDAMRTPRVGDPSSVGAGLNMRRVLVVDTDPAIRGLLKFGLVDAGYEVELEEVPRRATDRLAVEPFDAVILDVQLGTTNGLEVLRSFRNQNQHTAVVLTSSLRDHDIAVVAMQDGADDFIRKPFSLETFEQRLSQSILRRGKFAQKLGEERSLTEKLRASNLEILDREAELESLAIRSIRSLVLSLEAKDAYTKDHSIKVALLSARIAKQLGMTDVQTREVRLAGLLHDVGKIGVRESILNKQGRLDDEELEHMRLHPAIGARILLPLSHRFPDVVDAVRCEHERWDGKGYPAKISGDAIPMAARIIAVADCHDAITSNRPYRGAQAREFAAREIAGGSGTQFDPDVVQAFLELIPTL